MIEFTPAVRSEVRIRGQEWIVTLADELVYANLLAEAFPGVRFLESINPVPIDKPPPAIQPQAALVNCIATTVTIVLDPSWTLRWRHHDEANWWIHDSMLLPNGTMDRETIWWPRESLRPLPRDMNRVSRWGLHKGRIYFRIAADNKDHEAFARKALRLVGKTASKKKFVRVTNETYQIIDPNPRYVPWIGNDARRWCLEKPNRLLGGSISPNGWGYRPKPE